MGEGKAERLCVCLFEVVSLVPISTERGRYATMRSSSLGLRRGTETDHKGVWNYSGHNSELALHQLIEC